MVINGLFNDECTAATKNKNVTYSKMMQWHQNRSAQEQYKEMRKIEKRIHIKKRIIQRTKKQIEKLLRKEQKNVLTGK